VRLVYRALAHLIQTERVLGLVTADALGRNGLESLKDLRIVEDIVKFPVYRPLLALDDETMNRELAERGLLQLARSEAIGQVDRPSLSDASDGNLQELEERVHAEDLAKRIAANSTRIQI
jgi:adenylyl- and sulfurtransferase ThiI